LVGAPRYFAFFSQEVHRIFAAPRIANSNDPVSALFFYRVIFPIVVQVVLVAVPALWGMHEGTNAARLRPPFSKLLWFAGISTLMAILIQEPGFGFLLLLKIGVRPQTWHGCHRPCTPSWTRCIGLRIGRSRIC